MKNLNNCCWLSVFRASRGILPVLAVLAGLACVSGEAYAGRTVTSATLDGAASVSVATNASISAVVNVTTNTSGGNDDWRSTGWRISATSGAVTCVDHPNHNSAGSYSETFTITAPATAGTYNAYFIAYSDSGCSNNPSATYTLTNGVVVTPPPPTVSSISRASSNPTAGATSVSWTVTFSSAVTGVDASDFSLAQLGGVSGAAITNVAANSATTWTVTASTGTGTGSLGLNLVDNDTISDSGGRKLGGTGTGNGNFTGEAYTVTTSFCSAPSNIPAGVSVTCVCDTFGRASLNPSTIFGANWSVSNSDGISNPYINTTTGLLRLTESTGYNAKAATVPGIFPAAGNYISVEFKHYAYNGTGADGVAVTLSDYNIPAVPGAFGGSLGYAQRTGVVGFAGGWVGIALDEYGNYQSATEGRVLGACNTAACRPQSVGVRGPGSGNDGYRWLGGTASNPGGLSIDNRFATSPSPGYMYQVIVDARNYGSGAINVQVNRDSTTSNGTNYTTLFGPFNAYTEASHAVSQGWLTQLVPDYWKISFTGSTGGSDNIHEIGSLRVCAQTIYPPTGGSASGFSAIDESYPTSTNNAPAYQYFQTGNIYMKVVGTPFKLWVAALTNTGISTSYVLSGNKYVEVKLVDNSDNACGSDASRTCTASCYGKSAVETAGKQILAYGSTDKGAKLSSSITLDTAWKNLIAVMRECSDSSCSSYTTTAPACSADSFSVRPTGVASVTSSNATNAATSGAPVFRAGNDSFSLTATTSGVANKAGGYTGFLKINNAAIQPVSPATVAGKVSLPTSPTPDSPTFSAAVSGNGFSTASGTSFTFSEVGAFVLPGYNPAVDTASPRGVFDGVHTSSECSGMTETQCDVVRTSTWTAVDSISTKKDCIANSYSNVRDTSGTFASNSNYGKYGCNFGLVQSTAGIGRFIPNEFRVSSVTLTNRQVAACSPASTFTYLDEGMGIQFTLDARSANGDIVRNYAGSLAKLALPADGATMNFGAKATSPFTNLTSRIAAAGFTGAWPAMGTANAGVVAISGTITVSSKDSPSSNRVSPDGPFSNVSFGIAPVDSDGVRILNYDLDVDNSGGASGPDHKDLDAPTATDLYFGQLRLIPALGSERLPLVMPAEILRWTGTGFVLNNLDSCTRIPVARLGLGDWLRNLNAGETGFNFPAGTVNLTFSSGRGIVPLSAPGANNDGSVNVTANLAAAGMGYLSGRWPESPGVADGTAALWDDNPWATATFGLYKGASQIIHLREQF